MERRMFSFRERCAPRAAPRAAPRSAFADELAFKCASARPRTGDMPVPRALRFALLALVLALLVPTAASAATFDTRFSVNDSGDIAIVGNTLMTCPAGVKNASNVTCETAKGATASGGGLTDNDFTMV